MAHTIYYDNVGLSAASIKAGTLSGTTFTVAEAEVTNEDNINDQFITGVVTSFNDNDTIRIDLGSAKAVDFIIQYNSSVDGNDLWYYQSSSATASLAKVGELNTSPIGWNLTTWTAATKRYWFLLSEDGTYDGLTEVIIGTKLELITTPKISYKEIFQSTVNTSYNNTEYSNKIDAAVTEISLTLDYIFPEVKTNLETLQNTVQNHTKFIYNDGITHHWVRLAAPISFNQVATNVFSATIILREQFI